MWWSSGSTCDLVKWFDEILLAARPAKPTWGLRIISLLFGCVFGAGGCLAAYGMLIQPALQAEASRNWRAAPARVTTSGLKTGTGSKGGTVYSIDIHYDYTWQGQVHHGSRYDFTTGSTNVGVGSMQKIVAEHPPGKTVIALVDPDHPDQAVLSRRITGQGAIGVLFPLPFLAVGICGLSYVLFAGSWFRRSRQVADRCRREVEIENLPLLASVLADEPARRKSNSNNSVRRPFQFLPGRRWLDMGVMLFMCVFWNGIVGVFLSVMVLELLSGEMPWFLFLFLIPFEVIGVFILIQLVRQFRQPKPPVLLLANEKLAGDSGFRLEWLDLSLKPVLRLGFRTESSGADFNAPWKSRPRISALPADAIAVSNCHKGTLQLSLPAAPPQKRWNSQRDFGISLGIFWTYNGFDWHQQRVSLIDAPASS